MMVPSSKSTVDLNENPFLVFYELTRACDLVCRHCRACAQPKAHPNELSHKRAVDLIDRLADCASPPLLVLTGGDPFKRTDLPAVIAAAHQAGLKVALSPSATPLVTEDALRQLRAAGLGRLALSLDGADAATHDGMRGVSGSFDRTLELIEVARALSLPIQINTTVTRRNRNQIDAMARLLENTGIVLWSVFFLVPVGRGIAETRLMPSEYEHVFERLWHHAQVKPFGVKTTEAPHYRRFVLQRSGDPQRDPAAAPERIQRAPLGINDGKGVMFVSHTGQIFPSGFMPITCGRFPCDDPLRVYREHRTFRDLRRPDRLKGKCGACEFRHVCGGSRARAFAMTRDPLAPEPDCNYVPKAWRETAPC